MGDRCAAIGAVLTNARAHDRALLADLHEIS